MGGNSPLFSWFNTTFTVQHTLQAICLSPNEESLPGKVQSALDLFRHVLRETYPNLQSVLSEAFNTGVYFLKRNIYEDKDFTLENYVPVQ